MLLQYLSTCSLQSVLGLCFQGVISAIDLILTFREPLRVIRALGWMIWFNQDHRHAIWVESCMWRAALDWGLTTFGRFYEMSINSSNVCLEHYNISFSQKLRNSFQEFHQRRSVSESSTSHFHPSSSIVTGNALMILLSLISYLASLVSCLRNHRNACFLA